MVSNASFAGLTAFLEAAARDPSHQQHRRRLAFWMASLAAEEIATLVLHAGERGPRLHGLVPGTNQSFVILPGFGRVCFWVYRSLLQERAPHTLAALDGAGYRIGSNTSLYETDAGLLRLMHRAYGEAADNPPTNPQPL